VVPHLRSLLAKTISPTQRHPKRQGRPLICKDRHELKEIGVLETYMRSLLPLVESHNGVLEKKFMTTGNGILLSTLLLYTEGKIFIVSVHALFGLTVQPSLKDIEDRVL
jgi:hypothetical protein